MNRNGHIIWSEFILLVTMGFSITFLLRDFGLFDVLLTMFISIIFFILGCMAPDFDHHKVQDKYFFLRILKGRTKHRGHWHSFIAMMIYGFLIFLLMISLHVLYWYFPVGCGMFGYFSHLLEDQVVNKKNSKKTLRLW